MPVKGYAVVGSVSALAILLVFVIWFTEHNDKIDLTGAWRHSHNVQRLSYGNDVLADDWHFVSRTGDGIWAFDSSDGRHQKDFSFSGPQLIEEMDVYKTGRKFVLDGVLLDEEVWSTFKYKSRHRTLSYFGGSHSYGDLDPSRNYSAEDREGLLRRLGYVR